MLRLVRRSRSSDEVELSLAVPNDLEVVGEAVELLARHCDTGVLSPRRLQFNLRVALAEALANAIAYGNRANPSQPVDVCVTIAPDALTIVVTDSGVGFDPTAVPDPTRPENLERDDGRGLFVLRHLVDRLEFNDKGNQVCLVLRAG